MWRCAATSRTGGVGAVISALHLGFITEAHTLGRLDLCVLRGEPEQRSREVITEEKGGNL